ncbi:MAG: glycosyltransferase [Acidimicrobiales bacterium]|jgi:glycosyltransferase involved in cell wall biosynthesis|nr:glycosyltransferase [Acidimicrobiales bacterium]
MHVVAIVPAKNRVDSVAATVGALLQITDVVEVLVVDDGSIDGTGEIAAKAGARVVTLESNVGKGGAVLAGVVASGAPQTYLLIDADLGASASHAGKLLEPLENGTADMVIGVFPDGGRSRGFGFLKRVAAEILLDATDRRFLEPLSGQRAIEGSLMRSLTMAPRFGLEVGLTVDVHMAGGRIEEIPAEFSHLPTGRGPRGVVHRAKQFVDVLRASASRLGWRGTLESTSRALVRRTQR